MDAAEGGIQLLTQLTSHRLVPVDLQAQAADSTFLCLAKEKLQKKRHTGGEDFDFFPSLDSP